MLCFDLFFLIRLAKIPVKTLSGFATGIGYSPENPFTTNTATNHAWNAVFIRGNWFLLDSTWGAGYLGDDKEYKAEFDEFYFLTDPDKFAISHFPYIDDATDETMKWQLLKKPLSLKTFNCLLYIKPSALTIGLLPASHKETTLQFNDEIELTFKEDRPKTTKKSTKLYREENNVLQEEPYCCYAYMFKGFVRVKVKPPKSGTYRLTIFGNNRSSDSYLTYLRTQTPLYSAFEGKYIKKIPVPILLRTSLYRRLPHSGATGQVNSSKLYDQDAISITCFVQNDDRQQHYEKTRRCIRGDGGIAGQRLLYLCLWIEI